MKRLIACAALLVYAAVVFTATRELAAVRADDFPLKSTNDTTHGKFFTFSVGAESAPDPLREAYVEQQRAKAALMSDDELKKALESTASEIRVMQAKQKLDQTAAALRSIVKDFEGTPSAQLAKEMLKLHERGPVQDTRPL